LLQFEIRPPFESYIKKIKEKPLKQLFEKAVHTILADPYSGQQKIGDFQGFWGYDIRYQNVSYEVAYYINEDEDENPKSIVFFMAGTRENFWDTLKKYIN
jgi:mRNA interferase RelE/StbE